MFERHTLMQESDFWTRCGEAMELSVEGNRLIALQLAQLARNLWKRAMHSFEGFLHGLGHQQH